MKEFFYHLYNDGLWNSNGFRKWTGSFGKDFVIYILGHILSFVLIASALIGAMMFIIEMLLLCDGKFQLEIFLISLALLFPLSTLWLIEIYKNAKKKYEDT